MITAFLWAVIVDANREVRPEGAHNLNHFGGLPPKENSVRLLTICATITGSALLSGSIRSIIAACIF